MSLCIDTSEWISGSLIIGDVGLGALGSSIPSTGDNGPGYTYNDLDLPADANKEICGRITTWPSAGTLFAHEDTSFEFSGAPNGVYTFQYQLYVDGVAVGSPTTVTLTVGGISHAATGSLIANSSTISGIAERIAAAINHVATGSLSGSAATIAAAAFRSITHAASGGLVAGAAAISGNALKNVTHAALGALSAGYSTLSGSAAIRIVHDAFGGMIASHATLNGATSHVTEGVISGVPVRIYVEHSIPKLFIKQPGYVSVTVLRRTKYR